MEWGIRASPALRAREFFTSSSVNVSEGLFYFIPLSITMPKTHGISDGPLQIDLERIIADRVPESRRRWIPRWLVRRLCRLVCQDELNGILRRTYPARGTAFATAALRDLDITIKVVGEENIPASGRFIFASNHPLGGLDGIALISVLGRRYGDAGIRFPVNDLLMNVEPLRGIFLPVNKFGRQGRDAARCLNELYASDRQVLYFPAGLVSRLGEGGRIADLEWQKTFISKAIDNKRDIIPVYFEGLNSRRFYRTARWRRRLKIGFNFEQILLPSELVKAKGSRFTIVFGKPIEWSRLAESGESPRLLAAEVREIVYKLKNEVSDP